MMKLPFTISNLAGLLAVVITIILPDKLTAQHTAKQLHNFSTISFQHLTTANGLSYGAVNDLCTDRSGNIWLATGYGLNMFNGKTVTKYYATDYPQLGSNNIIQVLCDDHNRIWVMTDKRNVAIIDEQRHIHSVSLYDDKNFIKTRNIIFSKTNGIILFTEKGHFLYNDQSPLKTLDTLGKQNFSLFKITDFDSLQSKKYKHGFKFDDDRYLFSQDTVFFIINYKTKRVEGKCNISVGNLLIKWDDENVMMFNIGLKKLQIVNIKTGAFKTLDHELKDQFGKTPDDFFIYAQKLNNNQYLFTTIKSGIYIYNTQTNILYNYAHNPADPSSISSNKVYRIATTANGWTFVVTSPNGVSYFNSREVIGSQNIFQNKTGKIYDEYISCIATNDNNIITWVPITA